MKFRKKPVVIEAVQWTGDNPSLHAITDLAEKSERGILESPNGKKLLVPTLEGDHVANLGDWIILGVKGELYPCKPDIFEMTYERVEEP